jgi:hypothetical protein
VTDPERAYLLQENADLRRRLGRWRQAALVLLAVFLLPLAVGIPPVMATLDQLQRERARALEAEAVARVAVEEAVRQTQEAKRARSGVVQQPWGAADAGRPPSPPSAMPAGVPPPGGKD